MPALQLTAIFVRVTGFVLLLNGAQYAVTYFWTFWSTATSPEIWLPLTIVVMWMSGAMCMLFFPLTVAGNLLSVPATGDGQGGAECTDGADTIPLDYLTQLVSIGAGLYFLVDGILNASYLLGFWLVREINTIPNLVVPFWNQQNGAVAVSAILEIVAGCLFTFRARGVAHMVRRIRRAGGH